MSDTHEVLSAFLDDEPFEPRELEQALSDPEGRAQLLELLALRHVMQPGKAATFEPREKRSPLRALMAAAAIVVALVGGYLIGQQRGEIAGSDAPPATRVVEAPAWQVSP